MATDIESLQYSTPLRDDQGLLQVISKIRELNPLELSHSDWGAVNFKELNPYVDDVMEICDRLVGLPTHLLSISRITHLQKALESFFAHISWINNTFNIEDPELVKHRKSYIDNTKTSSNQVAEYASVIIPYLVIRTDNYQEQVAQIVSSVKNEKEKAIEESLVEVKGILSKVHEGEREIVKSTAKIQELTKLANESIKSEAVGIHSRKYSELSVAAGKKAFAWLCTTIGLAAVTMTTALLSGMIYPETLTVTVSPVQLYIGKISTLLIMLGATAWSGKNYRGFKHQQTVYLQKATALRTYMALVASTNDPEVRSALLLEVTRMIFSETDSGMIGGSSGASIQINDLHRVLTRVGSSGS